MRHPSRPTREQGFTLVELLIATFVGLVVLGSSITLVSQVQQGYTSQLDEASVREEARFAADWIARELALAGANPYDIVSSECPTNSTDFMSIRLDPNQNGANDDVRINTDAGTPNGLLGGSTGACNEADEDITIAFDPAARTITRRDNNVDTAPVTMTDGVITGLELTYLDEDRNVTVDPTAVAYVQIDVTAQGRSRSPQQSDFPAFTTHAEVRLRSST